MSRIEPLSVVLSRQGIDINDKIKQAGSILLAQSRIIADTDSLVEQIPNLLYLIAESSRADMRDSSMGSSSWLLEESVELIDKMFSKYLEILLSRRYMTKFTFPLSSVPVQISTMILAEPELLFYNFITRGDGRKLLDITNKNLNLDAAEYFFFAFAMLPLIDLSGVSAALTAQSMSSNGSPPTTTSHWWKRENQKWYDEKNFGSVYERFLLEYVKSGLTGGPSQLVLAVWTDFYLSPSLYSVSGGIRLNYRRIFHLLEKIFNLLVGGDASHGSIRGGVAPIFVSRLTRLVINLITSGGGKFINRLDLQTLDSLIQLWVTICKYPNHEEMGEKLLFDCPLRILNSVPIQYFVSDYESMTDFNNFLNQADTRIAVQCLVSVFEVVSGPNGVSHINEGPLFVAISESWRIASACTWHDGYVPKQVSNESWRMDTIVKRAERQKSSSIFTWDTQDGGRKKTREQLGIPRIFNRHQKRQKSQDVVISPTLSWTSPICSNEFAWLVNRTREFVEYITGEDLEKNPKFFSFIRKFLDVSVLLVLTVLVWLYVSIAWCPSMSSARSILVVQGIFMAMISILSIKLVGSQYIV